MVKGKAIVLWLPRQETVMGFEGPLEAHRSYGCAPVEVLHLGGLRLSALLAVIAHDEIVVATIETCHKRWEGYSIQRGSAPTDDWPITMPYLGVERIGQ